jgi:hypothetical protein
VVIAHSILAAGEAAATAEGMGEAVRETRAVRIPVLDS